MTGNPPFGNKLQLYSENGYLLKILPSGDICGTEDDSDSFTHMEILTGGDVGLVKIQGICTKLFVCFDCNGQLYGECDSTIQGTIFKEYFQGSYTGYESACFPGWYMGIKKNGLPKKGHRTRFGQKAVKFLPRRLYNFQ